MRGSSPAAAGRPIPADLVRSRPKLAGQTSGRRLAGCPILSDPCRNQPIAVEAPGHAQTELSSCLARSVRWLPSIRSCGGWGAGPPLAEREGGGSEHEKLALTKTGPLAQSNGPSRRPRLMSPCDTERTPGAARQFLRSSRRRGRRRVTRSSHGRRALAPTDGSRISVIAPSTVMNDAPKRGPSSGRRGGARGRPSARCSETRSFSGGSSAQLQPAMAHWRADSAV